MEVKTIICATPEELSTALNQLLTHFDLWDVKHNTVTVGGKPQFIAYVYGREKEA